MVINGKFSPHQYQAYAYTDDHHQNPHKSYAYKEDYYAEDDFYESSSSSVNMKPSPYTFTPQPPTHHMVGLGGHGYGKYSNGMNHSDGYYNGTQDYYGHGHGKYSNGMNHSDGYYSDTQDYYGHGHGNGMPLNGMHHNKFNSGYEAQHGAYMQMGSNRHDYANHNYHEESLYPPHGKNYKHHNTWAGKSADWISKGF